MNWDSVDGYRKLRWGNSSGGLISQNLKWSTNIPVGLSSGFVLLIDNTCYAYGDDHVIHSIDINNGKVKWSSNLEHYELLSLHGFYGTNHYLIAGTYVLDTKNGEVLTELGKHTKHIAMLGHTPTEIHDGKVFKPINTKEAPGQILIYNLESKDSEIIDAGLLNLCMPQGDIAYGWKQEDNRYILSSYEFSTSKLLTVNSDVQSGRLSAEGNNLLILNQSNITMIDLQDGSILWSTNTASLMDTLDPKNVFSFKICMSEDTLGLFHSGHYVQLNRFDGQKLWDHEFDENVETCVIGDLIYAVHGIRYNDQLMCALDLYTGDELWSRESGLPLYSVKAKDNKVLFVSVSGEILCYEWDESNPYCSPAKP